VKAQSTARRISCSALAVAFALACLASPPLALAQVAPAAPKTDAPASSAENVHEPLREALANWSLARFLDWIREHGLSILVIVLAMTAVLWLANQLPKRLVPLLIRSARRGSAAERENRARTLAGVLSNTLRTATIVLGLVMILEEIGLKIGPLLGGVAIVGLAVAFGAQSLIKDYFTGFLVLLEQQYMIGDVVKIGAITGQVEQITLRLTMLRDLEGAAHFIPHGQINLVSNLTHGWSQALFDLTVPNFESVERIRDLFFELARELRSDSTYGPMIVNDPEMLGVDSLGEATYTIKFVLRTLPLKRWEVKRELLRRLKDRFQHEQIKVTVPA
jgi:moderate conductance mechanosensitive channel